MQSHHYCVFLCLAESHQIVENALTHLHVQAAQRVVQQKYLVSGIQSSGQGYSSFLTSRQICKLLLDVSHISILQLLEILIEAANLDCTVIVLFFVRVV